MPTRLHPVFFAAMLCAAPAVAQTQPADTDLARRYYQSATEHFAHGRYAEAAQAFREAHEISHRPELLFNVGRALEAAGDPRGAREALMLFRSAGAPGFDRAALDQQIEALTRAIDAQATREAAPTAPTAPTVVEHTVVQPAWYRVEHRRSTLSTVGPWALVGAGAVVGVVGVVQGVMALEDIETLRDVNRGNVQWNAAAAQAAAHADGEVTRAWILGGVGVAMAAGGVAWLLLRGPGERVVVRTAPGLSLLPGGGAALTLGGAL